MFSLGCIFRWLHFGVVELRSRDPGRASRLAEPDAVTLQRVALAVLFFVIVVLFIAALRKARRLRELTAKERKKLDGYLRSRGLGDSERSLLDDVVRSSGEPAERVVRLVLSFDRGVDQYLADLGAVSEEDRMQKLRRLKSLRFKLGLHRVAPGVPLLSTRELAPGQEFLSRFSDNSRGKVFAGVLRDLDDSGMLVEFPGGGAARAEVGGVAVGDIDVYFFRRGDSGYRFRTRILSEASTEALKSSKEIWLLAHPRKLSREQRRHFLRIPVNETVSFALVPQAAHGFHPADLKVDHLPHDRQGTIVDLSGGGLRLVSEGAPIQPEDLLVLRLPFLEPPLNQALLVARSMKVYRKNAEFGFTFEELSENAAAALLRHVEMVHRQIRCDISEPTEA